MNLTRVIAKFLQYFLDLQVLDHSSSTIVSAALHGTVLSSEGKDLGYPIVLDYS